MTPVAKACSNGGKEDEAFKEFTIAIELSPPDVDWPYMARGSCHNHFGNWLSAVNDFTKALRITPDFPDALGQRGHAYAELGYFDEARADFEKFLELTNYMPWYDDWRAEIEDWLRENP